MTYIIDLLEKYPEGIEYIESWKKILNWEVVENIEDIRKKFNKVFMKNNPNYRWWFEPTIFLSYAINRLNTENKWEKVNDDLWKSSQEIKQLLNLILNKKS